MADELVKKGLFEDAINMYDISGVSEIYLTFLCLFWNFSNKKKTILEHRKSLRNLLYAFESSCERNKTVRLTQRKANANLQQFEKPARKHTITQSNTTKFWYSKQAHHIFRWISQ